MSERDNETDDKYDKYHIGRKRGILTEADREYLVGKREIDDEQKERNTRFRIRERILNALLDMRILSDHFPDRDLQMIHDPLTLEERRSVREFSQRVYSGSVSRVSEGDSIDGLEEQLREIVRDEIRRYDPEEEVKD